MFFGTYPSDHMKMPPMCSQKSGFLFAGVVPLKLRKKLARFAFKLRTRLPVSAQA